MSEIIYKELDIKQQDLIRALLKDNAFNQEFLLTCIQEYLLTNELIANDK